MSAIWETNTRGNGSVTLRERHAGESEKHFIRRRALIALEYGSHDLEFALTWLAQLELLKGHILDRDRVRKEPKDCRPGECE